MADPGLHGWVEAKIGSGKWERLHAVLKNIDGSLALHKENTVIRALSLVVDIFS